MAITWRTDYAIRIMLEAARIGRRTTVRELSEAADVPYDFARSISRELARSELLASRRGVKGGFELARDSSEITLLDIFEAMGEPASLALCTGCRSECDRSGVCPMHNTIWTELDERIVTYLSGVSLADATAAELPVIAHEWNLA